MATHDIAVIGASAGGVEALIRLAVARATKTLRGVEGAWVKDMNVSI